jgi:uncharacterized membrane protein YeiB
MLFFYSENSWNKSHGIPPNILYADLNTWIQLIIYRLFRLFIGIIGSIYFFLTFSILFRRIPKGKLITFFSDCGRYTLELYILQAIILERIITHYLQFDNLNQLLYNFVITPIISIITLLLLMFFTKCIYKHQIIGKLLFGTIKYSTKT